jgi:hypothetical protein
MLPADIPAKFQVVSEYKIAEAFEVPPELRRPFCF